MRVKELIEIAAPIPVWINERENDECHRYDEPSEIPVEYHNEWVEYLTTDGAGELTIEIAGLYDFEKVEPTYTGGGIYIFTGRLDNGNYFIADGDNFWVRLVNADPHENWDESGYEEWQVEHLVRDLCSPDDLEFMKSMINWIRMNRPDGNYDMHDMDRIEEELDECIEQDKEHMVWR